MNEPSLVDTQYDKDELASEHFELALKEVREELRIKLSDLMDHDMEAAIGHLVEEWSFDKDYFTDCMGNDGVFEYFITRRGAFKAKALEDVLDVIDFDQAAKKWVDADKALHEEQLQLEGIE
jgi:hypothetical protein